MILLQSSVIYRFILAALWIFLLSGCSGSGVPAATSVASEEARADGYGLHIVAVNVLSDRLIEIQITTPTLRIPAKVRILFPQNYGADNSMRYPVLYLLHGGNGSAATWTDSGVAQDATAGLPVIVVMPDIAESEDTGGWCADWYNNGAGGSPMWETFHIKQVIPWVDAHFRTKAARASRAIAGGSEGGYCSMSYAARFPDLFGTVMTYSGGLDAWYYPNDQAAFIAVVTSGKVSDGEQPFAIFGDPVTNASRWAGNDPTTLAENLRNTNMRISFHDGAIDTNVVDVAIEGIVSQMSRDFSARLTELQINHTTVDDGPGIHEQSEMDTQFRESIGFLMTSLSNPLLPPPRIDYLTIKQNYSVYGWTVAMQNGASQFSRLTDADATGFSLTGNGAAVVTTPGLYQPGNAYVISVQQGSDGQSTRLLADKMGHLTIPVQLGSVSLQPPSLLGLESTVLGAAPCSVTITKAN